MSERLILRCEDSLEGIFTAIYDGFVYKNQGTKPYTDSITIAIGEEGNLELFAREIVIATDREKAAKTVDAIQKKLGHYVYQKLFYALCHFDEDRGSAVFGYLVRAFPIGTRIEEHLADPYVMRVLELSRKAGNECQRLYGFLRFRDMGRFLYAQLEPKCNAIPIIMDHFEERYPNENFIIYDRLRHYAFVHQAFQPGFFVQGDEMNLDLSKHEDYFEELWKQYFATMEIKERHNEKCQRNMLPKWYRTTMLEFQS